MKRTEGTKYFFLSMVGMSVLSAFSQMTCTKEMSQRLVLETAAALEDPKRTASLRGSPVSREKYADLQESCQGTSA